MNTGVPRNTRALVERVRERVSRQPLIMGHVFDAMDLIARDCWLKLKEHITLSPDSPGLAAASPNLEQQLYDFAAVSLDFLSSELPFIQLCSHRTFSATGNDHG